MSRKSNLPQAGGNLFQEIKRQCAEAESAGIKLIKLSIGQPSGPALKPARIAAAIAVVSEEESMHEYQDNGSPGVPNFARRFVQAHVQRNILKMPTDTDYLPIPGIKPMLGVVIDAMGGWCDNDKLTMHPTVIGTMTKPGYPTPADQCLMRSTVAHFHLPALQDNGFLFDPKEVVGNMRTLQGNKLLMLNFPHNPTGIVAKREWLQELCSLCQQEDVHIFCDSAYAILTNTPEATTLTDVAMDFPDLNWCEAFSASKAGNFTGWRIGAMIGSPEFIGDIKRIKGNTDSGFAAPLAVGIIDLFENHRDDIMHVSETYSMRIKVLSEILKKKGMRLAVEPEAGFFLLFDCPKRAFDQAIPSAKEFNNLMIAKTGIVGVPFGSWIRYAVCTTDINAVASEIENGFEQATVSY